MSDKSTQWLQNAISDGLVEWFATRASEGLPEPSEDEQRAFRLGFTFGADAGIQLTCERLAAAEDV